MKTTNYFAKNILKYFIVLLVGFENMQAQNSFLRLYGSKGEDAVTDIKETSDKGLFFVGSSNPSSLINNAYVVKTDVNGDVQWEKKFQFGNIALNAVAGFVVSQDGKYVVFCEAKDTAIANSAYFTMVLKLDANGDTIETKKYMQLNYTTVKYKLAVDRAKGINAGFVFAGHYLDTADGLYKSFYGKVDEQLGFSYKAEYVFNKSVRAYAVTATNDGGFAWAGDKFDKDSINENDGLLAKVDNGGNLPWVRLYGSKGEDAIYSVAELNSGDLVLAGGTNSQNGAGQALHNGYLIFADNNGNKQWDKTYGGMEEDAFRDIQASADGGFILTGVTKSLGTGNGSDDSYFIKLDNTGAEQWYKTFGGGMEDGGNTTIQAGDGAFVMAGYINSDLISQSGEALVVKALPDGHVSLAGIGVVKVPEKELAVYPNPFSDIAYVVLPKGLNNEQAVLIIYDVLGNEVKKIAISNNTKVLTIERDFASGIYVCELQAGSAGVFKSRLVVE